MKKNRKVKTNFAFRRLLLFILILILMFFSIRAVKGKAYKTHKTVFPTLTLYKDFVETKGYNLLDEKVYTSQGKGIALYNASEGQKVPASYDIAIINLMNDVSDLKDELIKVNSALNYKTKNNKEQKVSEEEIESIKKIQNDLKNDNLSLAIEDINNLDLNTKQSISISELTELMELSVDDLNQKKDRLIKQISRSNIYYTAEYSGIVSYKVDGLEEIYSNTDLDVFTNEYLKKHSKVKETETKTQVEESDILFKLIDNFSYKIALDINNINDLGKIDLGTSLLLESKGIDRLKGNIIKINKSKKDDSAVVILSLDEMLDKVYSQRMHKFNIVKGKQKCFEIPKSAIIKRNKLFGVYVQEIHGLVKFVPIEVVQPKESTSYVSIGNKNGFITVLDKEYKTITINDAIVINPKTVDDSQILN